jgi:Rieske Fe-S protein
MAPDRRQSMAVATIAAFGLLALLVPAVVLAFYLWPAPAPHQPEVTIDLGTLPAAGEAVLFRAPAGRAFAITRPVSEMTPELAVESGWFTRSSTGFSALAAYSSDTGCRLTFVEPAGQFMDPCHGSQFGLDGAVLHGPARQPLARLQWRSLGGSRIAVTTTRT